MKKLYFLGFIFSIILKSYGQTEVNTYNSPKTNIIIDQVLPNNSYLARGIGNAGNFMFYIDQNLNITNSWNWSVSTTGASQDIHYIDKKILYSNTSRLLMFTDAGAVKWTLGGLEFGKIGQTDDKKLIVTGSVFDTNPHGTLLKLDTLGTDLWLKAYELDKPEYFLVINDLIKVPDGGFIAGGRINKKNSEDNTLSILGILFKVNDEGVVQWAKTYSSNTMYAGKMQFVDFNQIIEGHDGKIIAYGVTNQFINFSTPPPAGYNAVLAIDMNGNAVDGISPFDNADGNIVKTQDGYLQFVNAIDYPKRGKLKFLNKDLDVLYYNEFHPDNLNNMTSIYSVLQKPDKSLIIAGQHNTAVSNYTGWSLHTNQYGIGACKDKVIFPPYNEWPATSWGDSSVVLNDSTITDILLLRNFTLNYSTNSITKNTICTNAAPETQFVKISAPTPMLNNGTKYQPGNNVAIHWGSLNVTGKVKLEVSLDSGSTWSSIASGIPVEQRIYNWYVPNQPTTKGRVRILSENNIALGDTTIRTFEITSDYQLLITSPIPGSTLAPGQNTTLSWSVDASISTITIQYSLDTARTWNNVASTISSSGSKVAAINGQYQWTIPQAVDGKLIIRFVNSFSAEISSAEYNLKAGTTTDVLPVKNNQGISIYPVPANDRIYVSGIDNAKSYAIYSPSGILLKESKFVNDSVVEISELENGVYILKVLTEDNLYVKTFVK